MKKNSSPPVKMTLAEFAQYFTDKPIPEYGKELLTVAERFGYDEISQVDFVKEGAQYPYKDIRGSIANVQILDDPLESIQILDDPLDSVEMCFRGMMKEVDAGSVAWMQAIVIGLDEEELQANANLYGWGMENVLRLKRLRQNWVAIQSRMRIG